MTKRVHLRLLLATTISGLLAGSAQAADEPPLDRGLGQRIANFTLKDVTTGRDVSLYDFRGKRGAVIVFLGTECPIGNLYAPRLVGIAERFEPQGIVVLGINSEREDDPDKVASHAKEYGLNFPILKDPGNKVADALMAERTCEALVLDERAILRYRGAIDDQYRFGPAKEKPEASYLVEAIEALLQGEAIRTTSTTVVGCPIQKAEVERPAYQTLPRISPATPELIAAYREVEGAELPEVGEVTYSGHVAAIIQKKCQGCHRPGQAGPFSLLTYNDARRWATSIWEVVDDRRMPPWHADPRHGTFENDRSLSPVERATLIAWVEQGTPLGDAEAVPPNPEYPEGWSIGTPDLVFELPQPYYVPPEGVVNYQRFLVETNLEEDVWIQAAEARPGDRQVVHHIIVYLIDGEGSPGNRRMEHLCGYAPGDMPTILPPGVGKKLPKGAKLLFEMHYTPIGQVRVDRSRVGFVLAKEPVTRRAITHGIINKDFTEKKFPIDAGSDDFVIHAGHTFRQDSILLAFMPHMHLRGKSFTYRVTFPDGKEETLLSVPNYDFNWQSYYRLAEPLRLPKGTVLECEAHYDNSPSNPALTAEDVANPVYWGDQTWEEMMIGYIDVIPDVPVVPDQSARNPEGPKTDAGDGVSANGDPTEKPRPATSRSGDLRQARRILSRVVRNLAAAGSD